MPLNCSIVTPSKSIFEGKIEYISAPGQVGEFGVLPGHESFVTVLDVGIIDVHIADNDKKRYLIVGGYFEITEDNIVVIADDVLSKEEINIEEAKEKLQEYKNELSSLKQGDANYELIRRKVKTYEKMLELTS
ncbi:ATP synthase F1 subunit epsilon [Hippea maritima]|uniref:ATP synthase epsilon chain n=1 Tax=Hippea maritima (strain ATCC 700847 / DSM 10411 / MH2) TaxID=760142 RepID=F2LW25_HIPMA|nr:ATP synthase F1 subunit epsilon [Hippea maritima]AEA33959.1 ATP synthase epsilon chain [Hippea maritima DSM 10411]